MDFTIKTNPSKQDL